MCNDTQSNHQLQQEEHQQIEHILTFEAMRWWYARLSTTDFYPLLKSDLSVKDYYLKEHGLPLDSIIEGL
jgi:hypothetical protein